MLNFRQTNFGRCATGGFAFRLSALLLCSLLSAQGCSVKQLAVKKAADTLADSGTTYARSAEALPPILS